MCNLYAQTKSRDAVRSAFSDVLTGAEVLVDSLGNAPVNTQIWPDYSAPIIRPHASGWQLTTARWGMPTPAVYLAGKRADPGVTNLRNLSSSHWRPWLGVAHRCLVPFDAFSEPDTRPGPRRRPVWFGLGPDRPLGFFAGIRTEWTSVRKLKEGEVTTELFGFLTSAPNRLVAEVHPKAMPVILTTPADCRHWLTAPIGEALQLQRPLPDDQLELIEDFA